mgnify:FL=1|tara:strand:+ start:2726 stop:4369 length:1644 start_codon:yes stop_codon:yes gene_type:complete
MQYNDLITESFKHYKVKHKKTGKEYKVTAMHKNSALDKARAQHGGTASRYTGTSTSDFEIVESANPVNESLQALARHVKEGIALCDSPFRHGSQAYLETFQYAKKLREAGALPELDWESEEMLATDVGESVKLKNGETVWLDIPYLIEDEDDKNGMIGTPDEYYDAEERTEAYNDLQDALQGNYMDDYIKDGVCPACGGNGYQDGEEEVYNDETEEYEEGNECDGFGIYGCDQGEMTGASWVDIVQHDERKVARQKSKDEYPGDEEVIKQVASYMKRMDDPRLAYQQMQADFPHMGRGQRSGILAKAQKMAFGEDLDQGSTEGEKMVAKMLAKALGDDNRWTEMSASELYSELESINPEAADMIKDVAKMVYDVRLEERVFKDVGVADVVKDQRGKEFKFDKDSKKFKAVDDGEEADVKTKLGKDLMRLRRNAMKRTSPSYPKNKKMMDAVDIDEAEYNGKKVKLNKPMRSSGGGKKYKVYVKNPKTGRVKKISFGDAGLKTKSSNKKRAKSFAARHNCEKKNDKMKAGYWACRLPRYGLVKGGKWW